MADRTNAERQRRYIARLKARVSNAAPGPDPAELAQAKARIAELEKEIHGLKLHIRFGPKRRAAEPKAAKPPLPPDEERERIIKGLRTRVRNLQAELSYIVGTRIGVMSFKTQNTIAKVLHPDSRQHASEADRDEAYKLFNGWKADKDKAQRQGRS